MTGLLTTRQASDVEVTSPDAGVIAESLLKSAKKLKKRAPSLVDLTNAITDVSLTSPITGAPSLVLTLLDPLWNLLDSTFFDADQDGRLDPLELVYPPKSRRTWILSEISPAGAAHTMDVTFVPELVDALQHKYGPKKANRSKVTRAEFMRQLVNDVGGHFYCKQLDVKQKVGKGTDGQMSQQTSSKQNDDNAAKTNGIGANTKNLTCKGSPLNATQISVVNAALGECDRLNAPHTAAVAIIYGSMGESSLGSDATTYTSGIAYGPWQTLPGQYNNGRDFQAAAHDFLMGGGSFFGGTTPGAIAAARAGHPAWWIANDAERNKVFNETGGDSYGHEWPGGTSAGLAEAEAIVQAGGIAGGAGTGGSGTVEEVQPYYFTVGSSSAPHESYWDALQRLAQEVNWALFVDGNRVYYDSQMTLIKQKCAAQLDRDDVEIIDWSFDWETRQIATQFSLTAICEMFEFHAGDVLKLERFGTASRGSTAKLPGRWLVSQVERSKSALSSVFTLVQPSAPKKEPAPTVKTVTKGGGDGVASVASLTQLKGLQPHQPDTAVAAAKYLSNLEIPYAKYDRDITRNLAPEAHKPYDAQHGLDCSASVSWVLYHAGYPIPGSPSAAPSSLGYFNWGVPGEGRFMTVWTADFHVFIEFKLAGQPKMQGNTSGPQGGGAGFRYFAWGSNGLADVSAGRMTPRHWPGQ